MSTDLFSGAYQGRRCFVTGHTGFKGAWLAQWLHRLGAEITGYATEPPTSPALFHLADTARMLTDVRGDVRDYAALSDAMNTAEPEIVFHLAAQAIVRAGYDTPRDTFDTNISGTVNVLECARLCPLVRAVVVVTSDKCYENAEWPHAYRESDAVGGHDPYSASKAGAEIVCGAYRRSFYEMAGKGLATARAGNVIGGGDWARDRLIPDAVRAFSEGKTLEVRNPHAVRPWQHVLEPLCGYLMLGARLLESPDRYSGAWNFGPPVTSCQPVGKLVEAFAAGFGRGSWNDVPMDGHAAPHEAGLLALDSHKAWLRLGWAARWPLAEAVERTAAWYRRLGEGKDAGTLCTEDLRHYVEQA